MEVNYLTLLSLTIFLATNIAAEDYQWPEGEYGIVSHKKCPEGWYEFTHCQDTEDTNNKDDISQFTLGLGTGKCGGSSFTIRYCFIGDRVPVRKGGFWTRRGAHGTAFVIKNNYGRCTKFGQDGGEIFVDNEDNDNLNKFGNDGLNGKKYDDYYPRKFNWYTKKKNTNLVFCKIGESGGVTREYMEVGEFNNQKFGLFVNPHQGCPTLMSPYGRLEGAAQHFFLDAENDNNESSSTGGAPVSMEDGGSKWNVCEYDPNKAFES